jgi:type IV pilus assembly protein PilM
MPSQQMSSLMKTNISLASLLPKRGAKQAPNGEQQGSAPQSGGRRLQLPSLTGSLSLKRKQTTVVGLDIQPGYVAAARAHLNGALVIDRAAWLPLESDTVREGEVANEEALAHTLRELFGKTGLDRHVRLGVANQRTVMRMLEVPPLSDAKELAAAVRFQAEDQMPMPLSSAVIDFRPLGIVDTPDGARQRVLLVAAQSETVSRLMTAVKAAGLQPAGIDLSAFALIRSTYQRGAEQGQDGPPRVLHLNVGGLTNMVIAEGVTCRFARVLSRGLEAIAAEVAERRAVPIAQAREMLRRAGLGMSASPSGAQAGGITMMGSQEDAGTGGAQDVEALAIQMEQERAREQASTADEFAAPGALEGVAGAYDEGQAAPDAMTGAPAGPEIATGMPPAEDATQAPPSGTGAEGFAPPADPAAHHLTAIDGGAGVEPAQGAGFPASPDVALPQDAEAGSGQVEVPSGHIEVVENAPALPAEDLAEVRVVLEAGVRGIAGEVRNSLDFYQMQEEGTAASLVVLSGPALDIPGFGELLEQNLGLPVRSETVAAANSGALNGCSAQYFAIAAGLAIEEVRP